MSPEQARGQVVDKRTDIWAFGCVLYEMLTGRQAFGGEDVTVTLACVLEREPDFGALSPLVPARVRQALRVCLRKDPKQRAGDIRDVRLVLEGAFETGTSSVVETAPVAPSAARRRAITFGAAAAIAAAVLVGVPMWLVTRPTSPFVMRFSLPPLFPGQTFNSAIPSVAISPEGTHIAYATSAGLYVRSMSEFDGTLIVPIGATTVLNPTFSPDGQSIAFTSDGALKQVPVSGGTPFTICPLPAAWGLSWNADYILIGGASAIRRVASSGGMPEDLVPLQAGEWGWGPRMLPDTDWVLFTLAKGRTAEDWDQAQIVAQSISSGERRVVVENARDARYLADGHLVFGRGGLVFAARFDARRVEVTSSTVPVLQGVRRSAINGTAHFSVSDTGSLIYLPGPTGVGERRVDLVLADRNGSVERVPLPPGPYDHPRVSPDGRLLAFGTTGQDQDIWIYDLGGSTAARRLTFGGKSRFPIWSADGRRVAFQSDREGDTAIYWQAADGSGPAERLTQPDKGTGHIPDTWLPGEDRFLFSVARGSTRTLWTFSVRDRKSEPFDQIQSSNSLSRGPTVSPDGKWIAYAASDPITAEGRGIFVQPVPPTGAAYQISERSQGHKPLWSLDGREVIFVAVVGQLTAVRIGPGPGFNFSKPTNFQRGFTEYMAPVYERNYDMTRDGRFIGLAAPGQGQNSAPTGQINVIVNWTEELKRLVPVN